MKKIICIACAALAAASCNFSVPEEKVSSFFESVLSVLGEGTSAAMTPVADGLLELPRHGSDDTIIAHKGYTLSYDTDALIPEWVAYELTAEETRGEMDRDDAVFRMDPAYRSTQAMREDYSGSGWTRGHMACAGDFHWDEDAMEETFYLTNICPQDEELNGGDWNYLEKQVRRWARDYGRVWVVTGPIIGTGKYGCIGERDVVVPDSFFKAVLLQNKGKYHSIAFVMDNDDKRYYLADCSMSVNDLETLTGLDFFPALPDDIEESVEGRVNFSIWSISER